MKQTIEITSAETQNISGTSAKTGKPYSFNKQNAFLHTADKYPTPFELTLFDDARPYAPGKYHLAEASLQVDRNGRLIVNPVLIAITPAKATG